MKPHLHIQYWDTILVGDIETKWIQDGRTGPGSKRALTKPWLSGHIDAMQTQKLKLYKIMLAYAFPIALGML